MKEMGSLTSDTNDEFGVNVYKNSNKCAERETTRSV